MRASQLTIVFVSLVYVVSTMQILTDRYSEEKDALRLRISGTKTGMLD